MYDRLRKEERNRGNLERELEQQIEKTEERRRMRDREENQDGKFLNFNFFKQDKQNHN